MKFPWISKTDSSGTAFWVYKRQNNKYQIYRGNVSHFWLLTEASNIPEIKKILKDYLATIKLMRI